MIASESSQADTKELLIIGDLIIDETYRVEVSKLSPEAPVPVVMKTTMNGVESLGGAGLAAGYAAKHNIPITFMTACSEKRKQWIQSFNINLVNMNVEEDVVKTRFIETKSNYHLLRVDNDRVVSHPEPHAPQNIDSFKEKFTAVLENKDIKVVVMLDYCKGLLTDEDLVQWMIEESHLHDIPVYVDTRSKELCKFRKADVLKLNEEEYERACRTFNTNAARTVMSALKVRNLIVTQGKRGACVYMEGGGHKNHRPDLTRYNGTPDVTGCGDVFDVTFCSYWGIKNMWLYESLIGSVDDATEFAYELIEERVSC